MALVEIALFILPDTVCFPGTTVPLHVFEPRYRTLFKDSIRLGRRVAICHAKKQIGDPKRRHEPNKSRAELLNSNHESYEPHLIFSAGSAEIVEVTADGRLAVEVRMDGRYELLEEIQSVPYRIARCRTFDDEPAKDDELQAQALRNSIDAALIRISAAAGDDLRETLKAAAWTQMTPAEYSFRIFQFVRFEPEVMQNLLEMRSYTARLDRLARGLNSHIR